MGTCRIRLRCCPARSINTTRELDGRIRSCLTSTAHGRFLGRAREIPRGFRCPSTRQGMSSGNGSSSGTPNTIDPESACWPIAVFRSKLWGAPSTRGPISWPRSRPRGECRVGQITAFIHPLSRKNCVGGPGARGCGSRGASGKTDLAGDVNQAASNITILRTSTTFRSAGAAAKTKIVMATNSFGRRGRLLKIFPGKAKKLAYTIPFADPGTND